LAIINLSSCVLASLIASSTLRIDAIVTFHCLSNGEKYEVHAHLIFFIHLFNQYICHLTHSADTTVSVIAAKDFHNTESGFHQSICENVVLLYHKSADFNMSCFSGSSSGNHFNSSTVYQYLLANSLYVSSINIFLFAPKRWSVVLIGSINNFQACFIFSLSVAEPTASVNVCAHAIQPINIAEPGVIE
jgi:hypothetical protein